MKREIIKDLGMPAKMGSWEDLRASGTLQCRRSHAVDSWAVLTLPDVSMAAAVLARDAGHRVRVVAVRDDGFGLAERFEGLDDVLRVFDLSIERLEVRDSDPSCHGASGSLRAESRKT